jgi:hypothetical protein
VPRAALLARPAGPVAGADLAVGEPVRVAFAPRGMTAADLEALALPVVREVAEHAGRPLIVLEPRRPPAHAPPPVPSPARERAGARRGVAALLVAAAAGVGLCAAAGLRGGGRPDGAVAAPATAVRTVPVTARRRLVRPPVAPPPRGGPAQLVAWRPARPVAIPHPAPAPAPPRQVRVAPARARRAPAPRRPALPSAPVVPAAPSLPTLAP